MISKGSRIGRSIFKKALAGSRPFSTGLLTLQFARTNEKSSHFSVVVGKTVAKSAVARNKIRRRIYGILQKSQKNLVQQGYFMIFVKKGAKGATFDTIEKACLEVLIKAKVIQNH